MATVNKAHTYMDLGRAEEALQVCDELLECYKDSSDNSVLKQVATAMEIKASITADAGRFQDAAHIYRAIIERFRSTAEGRLAVHVANSFLALGDMYVALDQREQSISIIGELFEQFGDSKSVELLEILARAYLKKAIDLRQLNRTTEAVAACDEAIARFDSQEPLEIQQAIAGIMTQKAAILACVENASEANNTADQIIDLAGTANDPELDEYAGVAFVLKSIIASEANDDERALEYAERAYRLGGKNLIVIQQYMECLFASNKLEEAFQILELGLMTNSTGRGNRASLVAGAFSSTCHSSSILKRAVMLIGEDREIIVAGLTEWLRSSIPMTKESAERLGEAETVLREVLPAGLETQEVLRMLAAVRRDALGDTKALLELPLELRRLVKPELREGE